VRCFAFRGENQGHGLFAGGPCYAVHASDPAVALTALDAQVRIAGPAGERVVPLEAFYRKPDRDNRGDTVLALNELIVAVEVPTPAEGARGAYVKVAERAAWDLALVSAAVQLVVAEGRVAQARLVLGGVAFKPWRVGAAEAALVGKPLSDESIEAAALVATEGARPLEHNAYKVDLAQGVIRQALRSLL
jgi:xanthine dehydrogenase YagS FAD-binding subunit